MRRRGLGLGLVVLLQVLAGGTWADENASIEDELSELTLAVTRLVSAAEMQVTAGATDRNLERLRVLVSLLDIRTRRYESLQEDVRYFEDQEESVKRSIIAAESRIESVKERIAEVPEGPRLEELQEELDEQIIRLQTQQARQEHARRRQLELQNQLLDQQRLVHEVEGLVDGWLAEFTWDAPPPARSGP